MSSIVDLRILSYPNADKRLSCDFCGDTAVSHIIEIKVNTTGVAELSRLKYCVDCTKIAAIRLINIVNGLHISNPNEANATNAVGNLPPGGAGCMFNGV